jgi:hypothetical protein
MQWYVYLIAISATAFFGQIAVELVSRPIRTLFHLRRQALERMLALANISPPKPRELAISSREIREYDQAVRDMKRAQRTFFDLGAQLLALGENEPAIRIVMALFGLNIIVAGHALINLSEIYAIAKIGSKELRREIEETLHATSTALAVSRRHSRNELLRFQLEPIYLGGAGYRRKKIRFNRLLGRRSTPFIPSIGLAEALQRRYSD